MADTQTLGGTGNQLDVTWELEKQTSKPSGNTVWVLKIKVCNKTKRRIKGAVAENPWRASNVSEKMEYEKDNEGHEVPGSDTKAAKAGARSIDLNAGECTTVVFTYDVKPGKAYTDIYERKEDGTLKESWTWGTVQDLTPVQVSLAPRRQERTLVLAMAMPFPMSLDAVHGEAAWLTIDRVDIPEGFELANSYPAIGAPIKLAAAERGSSAAIVLRQIDGFPEGARRKLTVWERVVRPEEHSHWPERPICVDLVNDRTPPAIRVTAMHLTAESIVVEADIQDDCSGVAEVEALVFGTQGSLCRIPPSQIRSGVGESPVRVTLTVPCSSNHESGPIMLRAADAVGNETVIELPKLTRESN